MSLSGFQLALCEAIASPALARQLRHDTGAFLARYDLSDRERRRLVAVGGQQGMATSCAIYRLNRITPICLYLPMTSLLLGDHELVAQAEAFWSTRGTDLQFQPEVAGFGSFLRERLGTIGSAHPFLAEVLDFELAVNEVQFQSRQEDRVSGDISAGRAGRVHPLIRLVRFAHEPLELLEALANHRVPDNLEVGQYYIVIDGREGGLRILPMTLDLGRQLAEVIAFGPANSASEDLAVLREAGLLVSGFSAGRVSR
jgi:hypothetical protein